jgi:hypothetical protein
MQGEERFTHAKTRRTRRIRTLIFPFLSRFRRRCFDQVAVPGVKTFEAAVGRVSQRAVAELFRCSAARLETRPTRSRRCFAVRGGALLLMLAVVCVSKSFGGSIFGVVKFEGAVPERRPIKEMTANAFCVDYSKGNPPLSDKFVFGTNGTQVTLANVLVFVSKGAENVAVALSKEPAIIDQVGCVYTPRVVALQAGQPLEIRNSDATLHNVMTRPKLNAPFNEGMPGTGKKLVKIFEKPELGIDLRCAMHPWMVGYVHVMPNPFFAISATNGVFEIKGLPAGEYEISVFHEYSRFAPTPEKITVKVAEEEAKSVEFVYRLRAD